MITALFLTATAFAAPADLQQIVDQVAAERQVPAELLLALAYEASRLDAHAASAWGGYGLYDFQEADGTGPDIERVARLTGESPDAIRADVGLQVDGAAALLQHYARLANGGQLPGTDSLEEWGPAVLTFSGRQEPQHQALFVDYIFELVERGFGLDGVHLHPVAIDHDALVDATPVAYSSPTGDYYGNANFSSASSENYTNDNRSGSDIDYIVIHTVQGSYSGCISWFANPAAQVSAHYVVRSSDGQVTQMVWEEDIGWHAGNWSYNEASIGIEHEGYVDDPGTWYTDAMYAGSAQLSADIVSRTDVVADRSHIIAHSEVPGATHTDPGSGWDWSYYMDLIDGGGGGTSGDSATLIGRVGDGDINGTALPGAIVVLDQTGERYTVDDNGYYRFYDLGVGTWSVSATYQDLEGTCEKLIDSSTGEWWCSIAMEPGEVEDDPPDDDPDPEPEDTDPPVEEEEDPGTPSDPGADPLVSGPGLRVSLAETGGCAVSPVAPAGLWLLGLAAIGRRRRS